MLITKSCVARVAPGLAHRHPRGPPGAARKQRAAAAQQVWTVAAWLVARGHPQGRGKGSPSVSSSDIRAAKRQPRHIKHVKSLFEQKSVEIRQRQTGRRSERPTAGYEGVDREEAEPESGQGGLAAA